MPKTGKIRSPSLTSQESYSAVIIADLIAEVQQQPPSDKKILSQVREESNIDDRDGKASDNSVDDCQVDVKSNFTNGTNISKGVILNAVQFGQPDNKSKAGKVIPPLPLEEADEDEEEKAAEAKNKPMSGLRKIAFGFSFLPSIMFVVCFAVIFPCQKVLPCSKEAWSINLNHTEVISRLKVAQNVFFAYLTVDEYGLRGINEATGETVWNTPTIYPALYTECGNLAEANKPSCLVMDSNGTLSLFDKLNGKNLWVLDSKEDTISPFPAIIPDCDNDGIDEIAVAVSSSKMKIIFNGVESFIDVPHCESTPSKLLTWKKKTGTDLVLSCRKGKNEILLKIPQNNWCKNNNNSLEQISILLSTKTGILSQSKFTSSLDGFTLWSENTVTTFDNEGRRKWTVSDLNHTQQNQFLLHGNLNKGEPQVILYSSGILGSFQITLLNFENGNITLSKTILNMDISEITLLHGEKHDYILSLRKKLTKSFKSEAGEQMNMMSALNMIPTSTLMPTSVMNLLLKEELIVSLNTTSVTVEELILMNLDGDSIEILQAFNSSEGESYSTSFTAVANENKDLDVYVLRKPRDKNYTVLKRISMSNWDTSSKSCANK